ncbi:MAG: hypothetical protein LBH92_03825, partial [Bacteroidales bacterium]|nr:hypothetical protein [Bacteroidales bacterium]
SNRKSTLAKLKNVSICLHQHPAYDLSHCITRSIPCMAALSPDPEITIPSDFFYSEGIRRKNINLLKVQGFNNKFI